MTYVRKINRTILILIEDSTFIFDTRVKREAATLTSAGYRVIVVCPRRPVGHEKDVYEQEQTGRSAKSQLETNREVYEQVYLYLYDKWEFGGHIGQYISSLIKGGWLAMCAWREHGGFDCIQACNPFDLWFLVAFFFKTLFGVKFVFDHHDLVPELFLTRFGGSKNGLGYKAMLLFERSTFRLADGVISTNESYKKIAMGRGNIPKERIRVVRNGPDLNTFRNSPPDPRIRIPGRIVVGYLGNMNPQDGVELLLLAAKKIIRDKGRKDIYFVFIGGGHSFNDLVAMKSALNIDDFVSFTGRIPDDSMLRYLSSCDICVQPDPKNPLNNVSTMNKAMEYMALAKPVVAYDLIETRYSCADCALYAKPNKVDDLADKIILLADDRELREDLGKKGRKRVEEFLDWKYSEKNLLDLYDVVFSEDLNSVEAAGRYEHCR